MRKEKTLIKFISNKENSDFEKAYVVYTDKETRQPYVKYRGNKYFVVDNTVDLRTNVSDVNIQNNENTTLVSTASESAD